MRDVRCRARARQVKTLDGTTYIYMVQATTTVQELKAMITKDTAIPAQLQRIIFRGKVLCLCVPDVRACPGAPRAAYPRHVCATRCSGAACPAAALLLAFLPDVHTGGREPCMQVLKDALMLSEQKGVLEGGSVVHMIGRPPEAEGTRDICARFHSTVCRATCELARLCWPDVHLVPLISLLLMPARISMPQGL